MKKIVFLILTLLTLPQMAAGYTYWSIGAGSVPKFTPLPVIAPVGSGYVTSGAVTNVTSPSITTAEYTISPVPGYTLSFVKIDGVVTPPSGGKYIVNKGAGGYHTIVATFAVAKYVITTTPVAGGYISPSVTVSGGDVRIDVIPDPGNQLESITIDGIRYTSGALFDGVKASRSYTFTAVAANHSLTASFTALPHVTAYISNSNQTAKAGTEILVDGSGSSSNVSPTTYTWTVSPATATLTPSVDGKQATFVTDTPDIYTVTLTLSAPGAVSSSSSVEFTILPGSGYDATMCTGCHIQRDPVLVEDYNASPHYQVMSEDVSCLGCHSPQHLGPPTARDVSPTTFNNLSSGIDTGNKGVFCSNCHSPTIAATFSSASHRAYVTCSSCHGTPHAARRVDSNTCSTTLCHQDTHTWPSEGICLQCHNGHDPMKMAVMGRPHFSSFTTAQYVTKNIQCDNCHTAADNSFNIFPANRQWARTGKADTLSPAYTDYDFKLRGTDTPASANATGYDCVKCHTTTGYVTYITSNYTDIHAWGDVADRTREVIACNACHASPFDQYFSRRRIPPVTAYYNYSSGGTGKILQQRTFDYKGTSNLCITCHTGRVSGDTIKKMAEKTDGGTGSFWRNISFVNPHYMAAAGTLFQAGTWPQYNFGYHYRVQEAYDPPERFDHPGYGDGIKGPCVGCHMTSPKKHLFSPFSTSGGTISAITSTACGGCHGSPGPLYLDAGIVQTKKERYQATLLVVAAVLKDRGIFFDQDTYPYFFTSSEMTTPVINWDVNAPTFKGGDMMGAAFNLKLLQSEAGSWAHNSTYTRKLLYDTVDFLDDGNASNNTVGVTIQNLLLTPVITQSVKDRATAYIGVRLP